MNTRKNLTECAGWIRDAKYQLAKGDFIDLQDSLNMALTVVRRAMASYDIENHKRKLGRKTN